MVDGSGVLEVEGAGLNLLASLPPAAAASKAATAHCIIVSFCHMMAMAHRGNLVIAICTFSASVIGLD